MPNRKTPKKSIQAWAFVDTNIYLDFYRSNNEARLQLLDKIENSSDRIISTYQVQMEFLKNRQAELLKTISGLKTSNPPVPAVVSDGHILSCSNKIRESSKKREEYLKSRAERMLKQPKANDKVFQVLDKIFSSEASHVLTRDMPIRQKIKRLAWRRFILGYPPRKGSDTSIGDALNWEWVIHCASQLKGKFYIVSRDSDFGVEFNRNCYLNDQLKSEFRERVGNKSIILTNKLSDVLKALEVKVTKEELEAEEEMIAAEIPEEPDPRPTTVWEILMSRMRQSGIDVKSAKLG
jgi:hypothetical protein